MFTFLDVLRSNTNGPAVFFDFASLGNRFYGHLMSSWDRLFTRNQFCANVNRIVGAKVFDGDNAVIKIMEPDPSSAFVRHIGKESGGRVIVGHVSLRVPPHLSNHALNLQIEHKR
jgi:hypothetical protein